MILENYICSIVLIVLGIYTLLKKKNLIKIAIGIVIMWYGINLLLTTIGFEQGGTAPIFTAGELSTGSFFVDPIPQALVMISIAIGGCFIALVLSLVIKIYENYGTIYTDEIRRMR